MLIAPGFATVCDRSFSSLQNSRGSFNKYFEGVRLAEPWIVESPSLEILKTQRNGQPVVADTELSSRLD